MSSGQSNTTTPAAGIPALKVGCCGFAGRQAEYFRKFQLVEVQQTFYEPPHLETARRWRVMAPAHFEFTLKAWQLITHQADSPTYRRLRTPLSAEERRHCGHFRESKLVHHAWQKTLDVALTLQARRVLFQCPARFIPTPEHIRQMKRFFQTIDRAGLDLVWEPRGAWPPDLVRDLCLELNLSHAVDPFRDACLAGEIPYYRLHGIGGYSHRFRDEELDELKRKVGRGPAYVLFNNVSMKEDALRFLSRI